MLAYTDSMCYRNNIYLMRGAIIGPDPFLSINNVAIVSFDLILSTKSKFYLNGGQLFL